MDFKKFLKTLFVVVVVPGGSALLAYYAVQAGKKKYDIWKEKKENLTDKKKENESKF